MDKYSDEITKASLQRIMRRAGVKAATMLCYEELRATLLKFLTDIIARSIVFTKNSKRNTISISDIEEAIRLLNIHTPYNIPDKKQPECKGRPHGFKPIKQSGGYYTGYCAGEVSQCQDDLSISSSQTGSGRRLHNRKLTGGGDVNMPPEYYGGKSVIYNSHVPTDLLTGGGDVNMPAEYYGGKSCVNNNHAATDLLTGGGDVNMPPEYYGGKSVIYNSHVPTDMLTGGKRPKGAAVAENIKYLQENDCPLIPLAPFSRFIKLIARKSNPTIKFADKTIVLLLYISEAFLLDILKMANKSATLSKRITINPKDIHFVSNF